MPSGLDMSLDDIIRSNKSSGSGPARSRGRGTGPGPSRRFQNPNPYPYPYHAAPYPAAQVRPPTMFQGAGPWYQPPSMHGLAVDSATKIYVSNLDYEVSNEDIKELFSEVGVLKQYGIHYDRSGRSKGTAEVIFSQRAEAVAAVKRYHNVELDGKPMKIELVGTDIVIPVVPPPASVPFRNFNGGSRWGQGRGGPMGRPRGAGGRPSGRGRGRARGERAEKISAVELDADLDKYHSEAMQDN